MAPSVGIIIYLFLIKIHRPVWCGVGWGVVLAKAGRSPSAPLRGGMTTFL